MNPSDLRDRIAKDLAPARPLLPPPTRALLFAPIALATVVAIPAIYLFRTDMTELGILRTWGLSMAEAAGGLVIVALALRDSIPGRALSRGTIAMAVVAGLALPVAIFLLTAEQFDVGAEAQPVLRVAYVCFRTSLTSAIPALIAVTFLVARAFPLRPGVTGMLYGLGCGVIADGGLRLFCEFTAPFHVIEIGRAHV